MPPKGKRSKRKRKAKDLNSLRAKSGTTQYQQDTNAFILSDDQVLVGLDETDECVGDLKVYKDEGNVETATEGIASVGKKLSKSQQRKLKKIQEEKEKREKRQKILETLSKHTIGNDELNLLRSASSRGQHETKKEMAKRARMMERAGIALPSDMKAVLYSTRHENTDEESLEESSSDDRDEGSSRIETKSRMDEMVRASPEQEETDEDPGDAVQEPGHDREFVLAQARREIYEAREGKGMVDSESDADRPCTLQSSLSHVSRQVVMVERAPEIEKVRSSLPIVGMEQEIMESISEHDVVVLCGETGCGKTTQLPQFLYEGGYTYMNGEVQNNNGIIGVTQPRRVAAVSTARRVSEELGGTIGGLVGYHVRYDRKVSSRTKVQFMTDGILLRELQDDFLLKKYNVIIVDEAHERSLNTDVLLGMVSRVVRLRRQLFNEARKLNGQNVDVIPLKLVIMSATLRVKDFVENAKLFKIPPPVVTIQARQYPVAVHFQKKTELEDYVGAAYKKTCQIHRQLPDGGILVFLTGQREVETLCSKLRQTFNNEHKKSGKHVDSIEPDLLDGLDQSEMQWDGEEDIDIDGQDDFQDSDEENEEEDKVEIMNGGEGDLNEQLKLENVPKDEPLKRVWVLPLYAMLRPDQQARVFKSIPEGHRLIVVATNIAETSLTIPGIRYVVDAGRSKQRLLESSSGLAKYDVRWISKASADQRAGRSGRMGPGHCYRIYSSAVFNDMFPQFSPPEICNVSLEGVVLLLKSIGVDNVINFPFPSPPDPASLAAAEKCLIHLSAINKSDGCLTTIGKSMAKLPIEPRHARLLLEILTNKDISQRDDELVNALIMYALRLTASMSLESPFINPSSLQDHQNDEEGKEEDQTTKEIRKQRTAKLYSAHAKLRLPGSDHLSAMNALCAFEDGGATSSFCKDNFLVFKHLREGLQLTKQLERILRSSRLDDIIGKKLNFSCTNRQKLSKNIIMALTKAILAGWGDHVSKRVRSVEYLAKKRAEGSRTRAVRYECMSLDEDVFLHPSSSLFSTSPGWVIYSDIIRTEKRAYMVGLSTIEPQWIYSAVPQLTRVSHPLASPVPRYILQNDCVMAWHEASYGPLQWELPPVLLPHPDKKERAALFGMAVLDGTVVPQLKEYSKCFVASPSIISSPEMRVHKRIYDLTHTLDTHHVYSKSDLVDAWGSNPDFLRNEISAWVKKKYAGAFLKEWSKIASSL